MNPETDAVESTSPHVLLHPLALININDHCTRAQCYRYSPDGTLSMEKNEAVIVKTAGALLGIQRSENGRNQVEICTSFELKLVNQDAAIDAAFLTHQLEQFKQMFPKWELVGWYTNCPSGTSAQSGDIQLHQQMTGFCEAPVLLLMHGSGSRLESTKESLQLPLSLFETRQIIGSTDSKQASTAQDSAPLKRVKYLVLSDDAERIAVEHMVQHQNVSDESESMICHSAGNLKQAVQTLQGRIQQLHDLVAMIQENKVNAPPSLLREISSFCSRLPIAQPPALQDALSQQSMDAELVNTLSSLTKALDESQQILPLINR